MIRTLATAVLTAALSAGAVYTYDHGLLPVQPPAPLGAPQSAAQVLTAPTPDPAPAAPQGAPRGACDGKVNLNTAPLADVDKLRYVGAATLRRIAELRPHVTLDAVARMPGMTAEHWAELVGKVCA